MQPNPETNPETNLKDLRLSHDEVGHLIDMEVSDTFMGRVYRPSALRHPKRCLSLLLTEVYAFGMIVVFCLPISLLVARSRGQTFGNDNHTAYFLWIVLGLSVGVILLWNLYMGLKGKELKPLGRLLDEIDHHNEVVDAVILMGELGAARNTALLLSAPTPKASKDVLDALRATRESLVCALVTEKILRRNKRLLVRRQELFENIETNLATLQALQIEHEASEYGQLLNDALQIGLNVHREIHRLSL